MRSGVWPSVFILGMTQRTLTHHAREIQPLRNEPDTQSNPTQNICQTRRGKRTMTTVWGIVLPARDSKDRADARIPSKCTVCRKRGEMETARSEWENDQRVNERCHARLPDIQCLTRNTSPIPCQHAIRGQRKQTHHPTRLREPSASQPFFPRRKRANSGAMRWWMAAKPAVETSNVER